MEKRVVLAIVLSVLVYIGYFVFFPPQPPAPTLPPAPGVAQGTVAPQPGVGNPPVAPQGRQPLPGAAEPTSLELRNPRLDLTLTSQGAAIHDLAIWGCDYHPRGDRSVLGDPGVVTAWVPGAPGTLAVDLTGAGTEPDLSISPWTLEEQSGAIRSTIVSEGVEIVKTVRLSGDPNYPYYVDVDLEFRDTGTAPAGRTWMAELVGPYLADVKLPEDGILVSPVGDDAEQISVDTIREELAANRWHERRSASGAWRWIGVRSDFYLAALAPLGELPRDTAVGFRSGAYMREGAQAATPTAAATFRFPVTFATPGSSVVHRFRMYAGPNSRPVLEEEGSPYAPFVDAVPNRKFLFFSFGPVAWLMGWLLNMLASTGMGYGLAVIALTVLVRGALFPLSRKSQISMRVHGHRMAALKPKLDAVREKYKDPRKQQEMTMKVMREEKVSFLPGGCLLVLLQMPIWISLYAVLQTTFEMRHASFLWVADLTAPDKLVAMPFIGWLNVLPILMMATWLIASFMTPLPVDPQQAQQAKIMRWMPLLFGFFLYSTAAGLTLYMTMSAVWSIGENWLIKKVWIAKLIPAPAGTSKV